MSGSGLESHMDVREWLGGPDVREWSGVPPGSPAVV